MKKTCIHLMTALALLLPGVTAARGETVNDPQGSPAGEAAGDLKDQPREANEKDASETRSDTVPPEKKEEKQQGIEKQKNEEKGNKSKYAFVDPSSKEYVALFVGAGGYFPVSDYGASYNPGYQVSFAAGIYYVNFLGLSPEVHLRYASMDYRDDLPGFETSLSQVQVYPAIVYRYPIRLPRNTLTVYGRIWDGLSVVYYESRNPSFPVFSKNVTEYLNVFGLSAGCYYDVWKGFLVGVEVGYSIVSTADKPLQEVSLLVNVGWRIL